MTTSLLDVTAGLRACLFTLGGTPFALDVAAAREVAVFDAVTPVPRAPACVVGVANLRGDVVPIVDARGRLGLPERPDARSLRTLVVAAAGCEIALEIDAVLGLEGFADVAAPEGAAAPAWAAGTVEYDGRRVTVLDPARLVQALQREG
jgi:purine-binding chemotaxis protein CheW